MQAVDVGSSRQDLMGLISCSKVAHTDPSHLPEVPTFYPAIPGETTLYQGTPRYTRGNRSANFNNTFRGRPLTSISIPCNKDLFPGDFI